MTSTWLKIRCLSMALCLMHFGGTAALAANTRDLPGIIICSNEEGMTIFGYLSVIQPDGTAIYRSREIFAIVGTDNIVQLTELRREGNCAGKSIDELRASGQTIDFKQ